MRLLKKDLLMIEENGRKIRFGETVLSKILDALFLYVLGTVNAILPSGYSPEAVSISNIVTQVFNLCTIFSNMVITGMAIHLNVALGQQDRRSAAQIGGTSVVLAVLIGLATAVLVILFARPILSMMNVKPYMMENAVLYLCRYVSFLPVVALMNCFNNMLICNGYASRTFLVGSVCTIS